MCSLSFHMLFYAYKAAHTGTQGSQFRMHWEIILESLCEMYWKSQFTAQLWSLGTILKGREKKIDDIIVSPRK